MSTKLPQQSNILFPGNIAFAPALLDPDLDIPAGMVGPDGKPAPKRFSVYRNNVVVSLMEAMDNTYPSVKKLIGDDNFAVVARNFIAKYPPTSPMMQAYGASFPHYLKSFAPLQHAPFLVDVANLELAWIKVYHAADALPLDGNELGKIDPEKLMDIHFENHPAVDIVYSNYNLLDLFLTRDEEKNIATDETKLAQMHSVLITRPHLNVELNTLDPSQSAFFSSIFSDNSLGESVETALQVDENFDTPTAISLMLTAGAFSRIIEN